MQNIEKSDYIKLWKNYHENGNQQALNMLLYYDVWNVVMTYKLHMQLIRRKPVRIEEYILFSDFVI